MRRGYDLPKLSASSELGDSAASFSPNFSVGTAGGKFVQLARACERRSTPITRADNSG
jgi:hypothetical protein